MGMSTKDEKSIDADLTVEDGRVDTPPTAAAESMDSRDLDRAFVYLARHNQNHLDDNVVDLKALRRKIDWRIIPVMTACYGLQFLDKVLINYSGVMGIREDLHLVGNDFSNASSVFYIAYLIAMAPNGYILQKVTVTKWLSILAILWGIATACTAATFNYHSLLVTRIFAGLFESPASPCLMLISSQWYTSQEQASRYSFWFCGVGIAQISGAFISYGFQHVHNDTLLSSWRIMYLSLGIITSFVGLLGWFILPNSPMTAKFLTEAEKIALLNHIAVNQTGIENRHFKWRQLKETVLDVQIWFGVIASYSSIVIAHLGYSPQKAALLNAPSGLVTIITSLIAGFGVRYTSNRWAWIATFCVPGMIGGALMSFAPNSKPIAIIIGTNLVHSIIPTLMLAYQWAMSNCVGQTKRVVSSVFISGALAIGSIIGPQTFQDRDKPEYKPAKIAILATQGGGAFFAVLLFAYYYWANRRKDRVEAALGPDPATGEGRQEWGSKTDKENLSSLSTLFLVKGWLWIFLIHDYYGCIVKLYPDDTVVKSGKKVRLEEKEALDLAAELNIPAPKAYEASTGSDGIGSMSEEDRQDICRQLREILTTMQSVESQTGTIASCSGGVFRECRLMGEYSGGPFQDEAGFNNYVTKLIGSTPTDINNALRSQLRTDHRIVFSHGDLSQHNIIIKDMKVAAIIDWEFAGWFPEYWEYVKFFEVSAKNKDWREYAKYIFPRTYYDQLATFQGILRWGVP
ncbi:hypothetical protein V493_01396 [Pseudogymnoascus sp. VKM F-4281 (FW-2241)]|nr:hypothetical protein V493_01396 [Pseudogymnoascus sp. VKM F-4281 (FW-2241)]